VDYPTPLGPRVGAAAAGGRRLEHYLYEDGALAQFGAAGAPEYLLGDALASVRGVADLPGALTGTADYDVFGAIRSSSGVSTLFRFTGEQSDPTSISPYAGMVGCSHAKS
jgi:hypothetical protein